MKIEKMVHNYLLDIKLRYSNGTWRFYDSHLGHFVNFAERLGVVNVEDVTDELIVDYIGHMKETCANITINKNIGCLKRMYKRMEVPFPYLQAIEKLKERHKTFDMIPEDKLKEIRAYMKKLPDSVGNNLYYKSLILLLMDTGARILEILLIEKKHVNLVEQEILLTHTKTKEDRIVFISDTTAKVLSKLMKIETKHQYLLHNIIRNRPSNYEDVLFFMKKMKLIFKMKSLHAHMFRHSMASIWLQNGTDIRSVMDVLGHKNLETTQRYLHMSKEHAKNMYRKNYNLD